MTVYKRDTSSATTMYERERFSYYTLPATYYAEMSGDNVRVYMGSGQHLEGGKSYSWKNDVYVYAYTIDNPVVSKTPVNTVYPEYKSIYKAVHGKTIYDYEALSSSDFGKIPDTLNLVSDEITMVASEVTDTSSDTIALGQMHKKTR